MGSKRTGASYHDDDDDDEESKLLRTIPPGISARTHSISGTQSSILEPPEIYKSRWRSIRVMYLTMFLSSVSFSICMSSLYPYLKILDKKASTNFLGWIVAAYSVGQLAASPVFGAWSNFRSRTREPIIVSLIINILANVLYMYLESIHHNAKIFLLLARVFIGFGAGNVAVVRSYVSGATTLKERTSAMANMSAFQAIGFIIGPLIQTALVPIGFPGPSRSDAFHFDMYTATGFFSAILGIINVLLLVLVFKEHTVSDDLYSPRNIQDAVDESSEEDVSKPDYYAVIPSIALFFSVLFIFSVFETIATPMSMHMFAWKKSEATLFIGIMLGVAGFVSIFVFAVIKTLSTRVSERYLLLFGFIMCLLGFVIYLPWGHTYPDIQYAEMKIAETTINKTVINNTLNENYLQEATTYDKKWDLYLHAPYAESSRLSNEHINRYITNNSMMTAKHLNMYGSLFDYKNKPEKSGKDDKDKLMVTNPETVNNVLLDEITMKPEKTSNHSNAEAVGCPYYYDWCMDTPVIFLWQFLLGTFFISVGYPTCNVMSYSIYSKILGPKPQGIWMGWLTAAGSLARTLGPIFVSQVYDAYGPRVTFSSIIGLIVLTIAGFAIFFKRLIPFRKIKEIDVVVDP